MIYIEVINHHGNSKQILALFNSSFNSQMSQDEWEWKYLLNPFAGDDPALVVAMDQNKLVGMRPVLVSELWNGDVSIKTAQPCDTVVHPSYRHQGIFSRMNEIAVDYYKNHGYKLFYNFPNNRSMPGYLKQGWQIVSPNTRLFKFNNPERVFSYKLNSNIKGQCAGKLYKCLCAMKHHLKPVHTQFEIITSNTFIKELSSLDFMRDRNKIEMKRNKPFLTWRFDRHPKHSYKYIVALKNSKLYGYMVISAQKTLTGIIEGHIIDYVVKDHDITCFREMMFECIEQFKLLKPDYLVFLSPSEQLFCNELANNFGFLSTAKFPLKMFYNQSFFIARSLTDYDKESMNIFDIDSWHITSAFTDTR